MLNTFAKKLVQNVNFVFMKCIGYILLYILKNFKCILRCLSLIIII